MRSPDEVADDLLVLDAQAGDVAAFERLAARWHPRLLRYAARLTGDADGAREVTQETWLAVVKGLRRLRDPASFAAWALRVTARRSADWIETRRRTRHRDAAADPDAATAGERVGRPEDVIRVHEALRRLPAAARAIVSMHYAQGFSVEEMAAVLGVPPGTVKSRLFHARERLRAALEVSRDAQG